MRIRKSKGILKVKNGKPVIHVHARKSGVTGGVGIEGGAYA